MIDTTVQCAAFVMLYYKVEAAWSSWFSTSQLIYRSSKQCNLHHCWTRTYWYFDRLITGFDV